ncbi:hypothetical protein [Cohnella hashimotonis]|uniref:Pyrrolo-quinoline quinone n=1 Tax=Cohnella hashimotonis TaxID=2826895 RepID=A0ABT6TGP7_9BACL|nr:hypothetical protein [Cohnella hashimotonis]MDI4644997.1 hypothetical protein [Cohnella hashimotonis]
MATQAYTRVGQPCSNFNILATAVVRDPSDGRDKFVLSNYAMGGTGSIILIDPLSGEGESFGLPVGPGAWGLVNWKNEKLIVGTCVDQAYLHAFDLRTRQWAKTLVSEGEAYFWQMTLGSDGNVYGGTYPGCSLMKYDPASHTLVNLGQVSDVEGNQYSRPVWGEAPGYILVNYGYNVAGMKAYVIGDGTFRDFGAPGEQIKWVTDKLICAEKDQRLSYYDAATLLPFDKVVDDGQIPRTSITLPNLQKVSVRRLGHNRLAGVRGQDYFIAAEPENPEDFDRPLPVALKKIPAAPPPTAIFTLQSDGRGKLWGSSGFGQTVFSIEPHTGSVWNSSSVCNEGGEVYGLQFACDRLFMSAYAGGDHIVYDPSSSWDQLNNVNPRTLRSVAPELIRPEGRSVVGPDDAVWTGWSARYGVYGGGLSRIDPDSLEVESWLHPVPAQQIAGMAADDKYVYFTTNGGASGLPHRQVPCRFVIWAPRSGIVHEEILPEDQEAGNAIVALGGKVVFGAGLEIRIYDPDRRTLIHAVPMEHKCHWLVAIDERTAGAFCGEHYWEIDTASGASRRVTDVPGFVRAAAVHDGRLYFSVDSTLYRLEQSIGRNS